MKAKSIAVAICAAGAAGAWLVLTRGSLEPEPLILTVNSPAEMSDAMQGVTANTQFSVRVEFPLGDNPASQRTITVDGRTPTAEERNEILRRAGSMAESCKQQLAEMTNDGNELEFSRKMAQANQIAETSRAAVLSIDKAFICDRMQPLLADTDDVYYWGVLLPFSDRSGADVAYVPIDLKKFPSARGALRAENDLKAYKETEQASAWNSQPFTERRAKCDAAQSARAALKRTQREFLVLSSSRDPLTAEQAERLRVLRDLRAPLERDASAVPGNVNLATAEWVFRNIK